MTQTFSTQRSGRLAAILILLAGLIHLVIVPQHWQHAPAHGLFFVLVGLAEVAWGVLAWKRPSPRLNQVGLVVAGGLVILWAATRVLAAPFGHGPEAVDMPGVACKVCELLAVIALSLMLWQESAGTASRRLVGWLIVAALLVGMGTYGLARAAEPVLPWLSVAAEHTHEEETVPATTDEHNHDEHDHESEIEATPTHEH